jgi:MYXO-CTERM domain-containing protein
MQAAAAAVMADAIGGGEDTGDPSDEPADSADPDQGDSAEADSGLTQLYDKDIHMTNEPEKSGCGCATARPPSPWLFGLLLVGLRRRRS